MNKKFSIKQIALIGVMAAMIFVATSFIRIEIPTPTGPTMLKTGNILCLLAGLLLGKLNGGLAAGIGSMMFDLTNPLYIASAPFTFAFFFLMAFIGGLLFEKLNFKGSITVSCFIGAYSYVILYFSKSVIETVLYGSGFMPAVVSNLPKLATSSTNALLASVFAIILYPIFFKILTRSGIINKNQH